MGRCIEQQDLKRWDTVEEEHEYWRPSAAWRNTCTSGRVQLRRNTRDRAQRRSTSCTVAKEEHKCETGHMEEDQQPNR